MSALPHHLKTKLAAGLFLAGSALAVPHFLSAPQTPVYTRSFEVKLEPRPHAMAPSVVLPIEKKGDFPVKQTKLTPINPQVS